MRKRRLGSSKVVKSGGSPEVTRVRTPRREKNEILATVASLLGSKRVSLQCMDGIVRMGRIPGSRKKRMWIKEGDVVIANPWDVQNSKADVTWKYTRPQVEWLERKGYLQCWFKCMGILSVNWRHLENGAWNKDLQQRSLTKISE